MVRLDIYLVESGLVSTRSRAKRAIKLGLVRVNGVVVTKPSYEVREGDVVEIIDPELAGKPEGYIKLKKLNEEFRFLRNGDRVLDLGSSAGGFLDYVSDICREAIGVEISREFERDLLELQSKKTNVRVIFEDVFKLDPERIGEVDVILNDLTLEPEVSLRANLIFERILRRGGRLLWVLKAEDPNPWIERMEKEGFKLLYSKKGEKREYYLIFEKI